MYDTLSSLSTPDGVTRHPQATLLVSFSLCRWVLGKSLVLTGKGKRMGRNGVGEPAQSFGEEL